MAERADAFRLISYRLRGDDANVIHVGFVLGEHIVPIEALTDYHPGAKELLAATVASQLTPGIQGLLTNWEQSFKILSILANFIVREGFEGVPWQHDIRSLADICITAPVLRPTKMLFAGANYEKHVREVANWKEADLKDYNGVDKSTTKPYVFVKLPYCIIGPDDAVVHPTPYRRLDWEGEVGLVIGKRGKHIPVERAMDYVAGFLIVNDYSLRDLNIRVDWPNFHMDWFGGKNFDTAACLGPYLVPKEFVPDYQELHTTLTVNGVVKQNCFARDMIFKPDEIIAFVSSVVTLEPGDVISTGSPPGAGFATNESLKVGDVVETEIAGLGRQRNTIIAEMV
jgi:2,4-didehydro-3-deoxy-L-rhamnonate hydrolase